MHVQQDARTGTEFNKKCYKLLAEMHSNWDKLIEDLEDIGIILKESRQLEEAVSFFVQLKELFFIR